MEATRWTPNGDETLGLYSAELGPVDGRRTPASLQRRVDALSGETNIVGLDRLPLAAAGEAAHVWLGLTSRYGGVDVDFVNFAANLGPGLSGEAPLYSVGFPLLHRLSGAYRDLGVPELVEVARWNHGSDVVGEVSGLGRRRIDPPRRLDAVGSIRIAASTWGPRWEAWLRAQWDDQRETAARRGTTTWLPEYHLSCGTAALVHEFGHLVEASVWEHGKHAGYELYTALSAALLGELASVSTKSWGYHLANFSAHSFECGPYEGDNRQKARRRKLLRPIIGDQLGRYALTNREEMFAEAFTLAVLGVDRDFSERWATHVEPVLEYYGVAGQPDGSQDGDPHG